MGDQECMWVNATTFETMRVTRQEAKTERKNTVDAFFLLAVL
jgi:hypothetical protein